MIKCASRGFTLVELAVTLVIVGIIIGAITSGAHLINVARLNKVITEITGYVEAIENFKVKYHAWPGDMPNAFDYWGTTCAAMAADCNGNGDESIEGDLTERIRAWRHLSLADMIVGDYSGVDAGAQDFVIDDNVPGSTVKGAYYFLGTTPTAGVGIYGIYGTQIQIGISETAASYQGSALSAADTYIIDKKIDGAENRVASDGEIFAIRSAINAATAGSCVDGNYLSDASANYVLSDNNTSCRMILWLDKI